MADLDQLLTEFIERQLAGEGPDPRQFIERADVAEREELADLIDAFYVEAPARRWDAAAFRGSPAERIAEGLDRSLRGRAGYLPSLLPQLSIRAKIKRAVLVEGLADTLRVPSRQDKVGMYYHQLERGLLPAAGVSAKVWDALAGILGTTADALRRAAEPLALDTSTQDDLTDKVAAFARTAQPAPEYGDAEVGARQEPLEEWDEVDQLFRGERPG